MPSCCLGMNAMSLARVFLVTVSILSIIASSEETAFEIFVSRVANRPTNALGNGMICVNLDWWPSDKCDYGHCVWGNASLLEIDLGNALLQDAVKQLGPVYLRLGGTLSDQVVYTLDSRRIIEDDLLDSSHSWPNWEACKPFRHSSWTRSGFTGGCLQLERLREISDFCEQADCEMVRFCR